MYVRGCSYICMQCRVHRSFTHKYYIDLEVMHKYIYFLAYTQNQYTEAIWSKFLNLKNI